MSTEIKHKPTAPFVLVITLLFTAVPCSVRHYQVPDSPVPDAEQYEVEEHHRFSVAGPVEAWWSTFGDEDLDSLIGTALDHNLDIAVAVANVRRTRAQLRESGFNLFPIVQTDGGYTWQRQSERAGVPVGDRNIAVPASNGSGTSSRPPRARAGRHARR